MNIFTLSKIPADNPQQLIDKHVVKMILEHCQLMSTAHHKAESKVAASVYKPTHASHPSALWARQSAENYQWLHEYTESMCREYTKRYGRVHQVETSGILKHLELVPPGLSSESLSPVTLAMPDEFKHPDGNLNWKSTIVSYRNYYFGAKLRMAVWSGVEPPEWFQRRADRVGLTLDTWISIRPDGKRIRKFRYKE